MMGKKGRKFEIEALAIGLVIVLVIIVILAGAGNFFKSPEASKHSPSPVVAPQPVKKTEPQPVKKTEPQPVKKTKPQPVKKTKPQPVKKTKPQPVKKTEPQPVKKTKPQPVKKTEPQPLNKIFKVDTHLYKNVFLGAEKLRNRTITKKDKQVNIRFSIANDTDVGLKDIYKLLRLRPYIYFKGNYYSLDDGHSILSDEINSYASTIIKCEFPRKDFIEELSRLSERFAFAEVHYLMQPRTLSYFQYKNRKCLDWAINGGKIKDITGSDVTIKARVLQVMENGETNSARTGVYLPYEIMISKHNSNERIAIDIHRCFAGDPDIMPLFKAGIL